MEAGDAGPVGEPEPEALTSPHSSNGSNHEGDVEMVEAEAETSGHSSRASSHGADDEMQSADLSSSAGSTPKKQYKKRKQKLSSKKGDYTKKASSRKIPLSHKQKQPDEQSDGSGGEGCEQSEEQIIEADVIPETPRMSISTHVLCNSKTRERISIGSTEVSAEIDGNAPTLEQLFAHDYESSDQSDDSALDDSWMSANASNYSSDEDSKVAEEYEEYDYDELFSENGFALDDSCEVLDDDHHDSQDISEDTNEQGEQGELGANVFHHFSDFDDLSSATNFLAEKVSELLTMTSWNVDCTDNSCRLFLLSNQANVVVERSIYWNSTIKQMEIFINNQPVRDNSFLWTSRFPTDFNNISSVANYITMVAFLVESVNICAGVTKYEEFWQEGATSGSGFIESCIYQGTKCFRSESCSLGIISSGSCSVCNRASEKFRKRDWKKTNKPGTDTSRITNKSMDNEQKGKKIKDQSKIIADQRRKIGRLRNKIKQLMNRDVIAIDQHLSKDFTKILRENADKMSPIQKLFWQEQLKALSRQGNPKSMRWNPMTIKIALKLQEISPASLDYLRDSGFISLPSKRTLYDFSHFADPKEGVQDAILDLLVEKFQKEEENEKEQGTSREKLVFNLLFDEMSIKEDLVINQHGEVVGYVHLNKIEEAFKKIEDEVYEEKKSRVAKKILVYMLQGINRNLHEVVGIFSTINLTAAQLYYRTWDMIYNLERRSIPVIALICDAASINKKFYKMHVSLVPEAKFVYVTKNNACGENRPLFFIIDPPHLLKCLRNCLSNSGAHSKSRDMWKNNETLTWKAIIKLQERDSGNKQRGHKLTASHVRLTAFSRMRVSYALQVLSMSVAEALEKLKEDKDFEKITSSELINFLKICNRFFDCLNGSEDAGLRHKMNDDLLPFTNVNDPRFEFMEKTVQGFFDDWRNDIKRREGVYTKEARNKMFISKESYESIYITINGFCGAVKYCLQELKIASVDARSFNQDKLEQEFGSFRMSEGANNHPTLHRVIQRSMTRHVSKAAALPPKRGNTEAVKRTLTVDEEPLKRRKKNEESEQ